MSLFGLKFGKKKLKGECGLVMALSWVQRNVNTAHVQGLFGRMSGPEQVGKTHFLPFPCISYCLGGVLQTGASDLEHICNRTSYRVFALLWHMTALGKLDFGGFIYTGILCGCGWISKAQCKDLIQSLEDEMYWCTWNSVFSFQPLTRKTLKCWSLSREGKGAGEGSTAQIL